MLWYILLHLPESGAGLKVKIECVVIGLHLSDYSNCVCYFVFGWRSSMFESCEDIQDDVRVTRCVSTPFPINMQLIKMNSPSECEWSCFCLTGHREWNCMFFTLPFCRWTRLVSSDPQKDIQPTSFRDLLWFLCWSPVGKVDLEAFNHWGNSKKISLSSCKSLVCRHSLPQISQRAKGLNAGHPTGFLCVITWTMSSPKFCFLVTWLFLVPFHPADFISWSSYVKIFGPKMVIK